MRTFEKEIKYWPIGHDQRLNLVYLSSVGRDLDDLLCNAEISVEDMHGNCVDGWTIGDLSDHDLRLIEREFSEWLAGA